MLGKNPGIFSFCLSLRIQSSHCFEFVVVVVVVVVVGGLLLLID